MQAAVLAAAASILAASSASAAALTVPMAMATPDGPGASVGSVKLSETRSGLRIELDLHGLQPGPHGLHIHEKPSCAPSTADGKTTPAGGAGGHLDPAASHMHMGPAGEGHLGDLPRVDAKADGTARGVLIAPRITSLDQVKGHALMLHAGGDNYADQPQPLGGGGARFACGVVGG